MWESKESLFRRYADEIGRRVDDMVQDGVLHPLDADAEYDRLMESLRGEYEAALWEEWEGQEER